LDQDLLAQVREALDDLTRANLVEWTQARIRLTARGRMVSNEVFGRLLLVTA
jgi:coproporphyrinogen III oxidase-like Fe-S oxidoreductase